MWSKIAHWLIGIYRRINFVKIFTNIVITFVVLLMAVTLNGEWVVISIHLMRHYGIPVKELDRKTVDEAFYWLYLRDLRTIWIRTQLSAFGIYFIAGIFLHWYYYVRQKDTPEKWKCQPKQWLPRKLEIDEIKCGIVCLFVTNTWSSLVACYIQNEGRYSKVYYQWDQYGWLWFFLQFPAVFLYHDYVAYWCHRMLHTPYLYKRYHSLHHRYKQPTAFSTLAVHPVELSTIQWLLAVPLFTVPLHWFSYSVALLVLYSNGIISHSGIDFKFRWWMPFQPPAIFHDNHHQYYHVNFGINSKLWDIVSVLQPWNAIYVALNRFRNNFGDSFKHLHGTYRRPDRIYNENIYYGRGKSIEELTPEEIKTEIEERENEIPRSVEEDNDPEILKYLKSKLK